MSFSDNKSLVNAVDKWEKGEANTISWESDGSTIYAPGTIQGKPIYQSQDMCKSFNEGGTMIAESENCVSLIPSGFQEGTTINTMNPIREEIGGPYTLMSIAHVITIPKKERIYNACTLKKKHHILLDEMKELGQKAVTILINGNNRMIGSIQWCFSQSGCVIMNNERMIPQMVDIYKDISPFCLIPNNNCGVYQIESDETNLIDSIRHSFNVFPSANIGWLHLHSYVGNLLTTAHDTMERNALEKGYKKNTSYEEVVLPLFWS